VAHPEGEPRTPNRTERKGGALAGNHHARKHGAYAEYVPVVALRDALKLPPGDLRLEIAVTRAMLQELLTSDLDAAELIGSLERATGALTRLLKTNHQINADDQDAFEATVVQVLNDIGMGGRHD
jgi:uncharacterized protein YjcR